MTSEHEGYTFDPTCPDCVKRRKAEGEDESEGRITGLTPDKQEGARAWTICVSSDHRTRADLERGVCPDCGDPFVRVLEAEPVVKIVKLIAEHPTEQRNPDGVEQAAWSMREIARGLLEQLQGEEEREA